ncbi:MAG: hypothetical protein CV045_02880 [Cyanobacteria bacterium M5B4]|nr:MAG: hypothetical protein CV045_02880 [Cyanobacteria bacterium M5B4]
MVKQFHSVEKANVGVTLIKYFQDMGIDVKAHSSGEFGSKDNKRSLLADAIKAGKVVLLNSNPFIDLKIFPESTYVIEDIKEELCSLDAVNDDIMDAMFLMVAHFILSDNKFFIEAHLPDPDPEWIRTSDGYKLIKDVSVLDEYDFYEFTHIPADYFSIDF